MLLDELHYLHVRGFLAGLLPHLVIEVRTVERTLELVGIHNAEALLYVAAHLVGGSGGERNYRRTAYLVYYRTYVAVLGSEVMTPLRDAVSLIDGIEGNLHRAQEIDILVFCERLGSDIQEFRLALLDVVLYEVDGRLVERRVDVMCHSVLLAQAVYHVHLVLHQRYQRRDDYRGAVHDERRQLVAQRLAAACRHQHERVVASQQVAYNRFLIALESVEAEIFLQRFNKVHFIHSMICFGFQPLSTCEFLQMGLAQLLLCIVKSDDETLHLL